MKKFLYLVAVLMAVLTMSACSSSNQINPSGPAAAGNSSVAPMIPAPAPAQPTSTNNNAPTNFSEHSLSLLAGQSEAKFSLNELLRGVPTHVVGTSTQITGNVTVNTDTPAKITISPIKLDATSFITDNAFRNHNIINLIFHSNEPQNQFIVFQPASLDGVPTSLTPDQPFPVKITGNLTISGQTHPVTFNGTMDWHNNGTLSVAAATELTYADFGLAIPNFPFLANVDKIVKLEVEATAGSTNGAAAGNPVQ